MSEERKVDVRLVLSRAAAHIANQNNGQRPDTLDEARATIAELMEAAREVDAMYPRHWDLVEGGLMVMAENVKRFEAAFARLHEALAACLPEKQP